MFQYQIIYYKAGETPSALPTFFRHVFIDFTHQIAFVHYGTGGVKTLQANTQNELQIPIQNNINVTYASISVEIHKLIISLTRLFYKLHNKNRCKIPLQHSNRGMYNKTCLFLQTIYTKLQSSFSKLS